MRKQIFKGENPNVTKFVFENEPTQKPMVAEAVLYKYGSYKNRTVICCSTMSGCPVGCSFCGTGKKFIRNLEHQEIIEQIDTVINYIKNQEELNTNEIQKFQIMFMSMGEPLLNLTSVLKAIKLLNQKYPNAQLLLSTIGPKLNIQQETEFLKLSKEIDKIGLQFSIHRGFDKPRNLLIPYINKLSLNEIKEKGILWNKITNRPVYLNYCINGKENTSENELQNLINLFPPDIFYFTFSVICTSDKNDHSKEFRDLDFINRIQNQFLQNGYNVRIFDPAGQDDIGGGCGQLWYVQEWYKNHKKILIK